jgi:hypothetical protein
MCAACCAQSGGGERAEDAPRPHPTPARDVVARRPSPSRGNVRDCKPKASIHCIFCHPDAAPLRPGIRSMRLAFANLRNVNFIVFSDRMPVSSLAIRLVISA